MKPSNPSERQAVTITVSWEEHLRTTGIPQRIIAYCLQPLTGAKYYERISGIATAQERPLIVFAYGPNGNGKTHMGTWLYSMWHAREMREWLDAVKADEAGIGSKVFQPRALWVTERVLTEALKAYGDNGFSFREQSRLYTSPELLMVDDVFTERTTETDVSNIADIIECRRDSGRRTIITSNRGPMEISERYSARLAERLIDDALAVEFTGVSYRMKNFLANQ